MYLSPNILSAIGLLVFWLVASVIILVRRNYRLKKTTNGKV